MILEGGRRATTAGLGFEVAQADSAEAVSRVLDITGLRGELPVHPTRADAVEPPARHRTGGDRERTRASPRPSARPGVIAGPGRPSAGLGEALGVPTQRVDDLKTVVTEACSNVVLHAYQGAEEARSR